MNLIGASVMKNDIEMYGLSGAYAVKEIKMD